MRDAVGNVVEQEVMRVWLDNGAVTRVSGSLPAGESIIWNASEGPYLLEDEVIVPATTSLVIEGGATVYGAANGKLVVEGVLKIAGTKEQRVTFAKDPSDSQSVGWAGIRLSGSLKGGATFSHADFLDLNGPIEVIDRDILCNELQVQWVGGHGLSGKNSNVVISDCVFRQRGEDGLALIDVKGGRLDLESSELERGAVIAETVYLFDNQFKQSVSPVIVMDQGFVDGNDFEIGSSAASPAIQSKGKTTLTRNRVFGLVDLMEASSNIGGNSKHSGSLPKRVLASADVVFLNQPPVKGPDAMVRFVVGGQGLASFRYQLDEGSWSEAVELNGKDRGAFALKVSAGSHQVRVLGRHVSGRSPSEEEAVASRTFEVVPGLPSVVISEVLAVNKSAYLLDDQFDDFIELHNLGDQPFDLSGYQLSDDPEKPDVFEFPQGTMLAPNAYQVWTVSKDETDFALSGTGETVTLSDPKG
ncbi:MAG: lamin tail domain-containing protein, partial [Verrucomicrobiales bacterium]